MITILKHSLHQLPSNWTNAMQNNLTNLMVAILHPWKVGKGINKS
jgi:hypothetical protein